MYPLCKDELIEMVKLCQCTNRFREMATNMKQIIEMGVQLSEEEREYLLIAYKSNVDANRQSIEAIAMLNNTNKEYRQKMIIEIYKKTIVDELINVCHEVLSLLDEYLLPNTNDIESKIFYLRMKGDFGRYLAEVSNGDDWNVSVKMAKESYQESINLSSNYFSPAHPIHLSLIVNYSIFLFDILGLVHYSFKYLTNALMEAIRFFPDNLNALQLKPSIILMSIMNNNIRFLTLKSLEDNFIDLNNYLNMISVNDNDNDDNDTDYSGVINYESNIDSGYESSNCRSLSASSDDSLFAYRFI